MPTKHDNMPDVLRAGSLLLALLWAFVQCGHYSAIARY